jgi:hypothetical protein
MFFMATSMLLYFGVMPMMSIVEADLFSSPIFVLIFSTIQLSKNYFSE